MWKTNSKKDYPTIAVRPYNGKIFANIPQSVLAHLEVNPTSQLVFKLRSNKTVSVGVLKTKDGRLVSFKPAKRRKAFPALTAFYSQSR